MKARSESLGPPGDPTSTMATVRPAAPTAEATARVSVGPERPRDRGALVGAWGARLGSITVLSDGVTTFGRGRECTIRLDEPSLSRVHARIVAEGKRYFFEDLGSTNGSYVNGKRATSVELADGDRIRLGGATTLRFFFVSEEEEHAIAQMRDAVLRDALTGAYNRTHLEDWLADALATATRAGSPLSVLAVEVDGVRAIGEARGGQALIYVLRHMADLLRANISPNDLLARSGVGSFAIVANGTTRGDACALAERVRSAAESTCVELGGVVLTTTVSVGVASIEDAQHVSRLLACAEERAYWAREGGGNCVVAR
jgi:diguanylate cyclase (GGDEF)-like protein